MIDYQFLVSTAILVATIVAIIYGPIKAVKITRKEDDLRDQRSRKHSILSDLMRTRQARIDPLHVGALNLIELEFYGQKEVIKSYRAYADYLNSHFPPLGDALERHYQNGDKLFIELLSGIARDLGYTFDKLDLSRLGYLPQGLSRYHENAHENARLIREVLEGKRSLPIRNFVSDQSIFPPAPERKQVSSSGSGESQ